MAKRVYAAYKQRSAAERYATALKAAHPDKIKVATVVPVREFRWGVRVTLLDGRAALAGVKPKGALKGSLSLVGGVNA